MSDVFQRVLVLARSGEVRISEHGYDEMMEDDLSGREMIAGLADGVVVEDYPDYGKGPCVLIRQPDHTGAPIHVVWGIPKGAVSPAVLVTAYRPDPARWSDDFMRRKQ